MSPEYFKGYRAGLKRANRKRSAEHVAVQQQAMLDRLFVAALPAAMLADGWMVGDVKVETTQERADLARRWALAGMRHRPKIREL